MKLKKKKENNIIREDTIKVKKPSKVKQEINKDLGKVKSKLKKIKDDKKNRGTYILIGLMWLLIAFFTIFVIFMLYIIISAPKFTPEKLYDKEATILYDINGNEYARLGTENRELVTYDDLPQVLVDAIVATEDSRYFQHNGFDIARFLKATAGQLIGRSGAGGASTLSMQVVKNTFTSKEASGIRGIVRKFTDIYMSIFKIEKNYTKEEIIEFYVNAPYLGNYSYGIEQASLSYFGKSVKDLTLTEAALMAGLFQAPGSYDPYVNPINATKRRKTVLDLMYRHGYITKEEKEIANSIPVKSLLLNKEKEDNQYQGFIDTVVEDVKAKTNKNPYDVPMEIYTTMDPKIQDSINNAMSGEVIKFKDDVIQIAMAITNVENGSISGVGTGRNKSVQRGYNFATQSKRHPGSSAKPFMAYGPLLEYNNASTYTLFFDEKYTYSNGTSIKNADSGYTGLNTMKVQLRNSRNIPALQAFQQVDPKNIAEFAHNCGIDYGKELYESYAIGSFNGVSPLSLSAAYATFARGGYYIEPYTYTKIKYRETSEEIEYKPVKEKAMSESTAFMINYMLSYAMNDGLVGSINNGNTPVAGKTGTSTIDRNKIKELNLPGGTANDSWVEVYSPEYSFAQWYGYDEITSEYYMKSSDAWSIRSTIARYMVKNVMNTGNGKNFPSTSTVKKVAIEFETIPAALASEYTPKDLIVEEYFKSGTEPTDVSYRFKQLDNIDKSTLSSSISGNKITLSWDSISTPDAINTTFLTNYFNENYKQWSEKYLQKRLTYNNNYIGTIGYQVYIKDALGNLTPLGFTTTNSYSYTADGITTNYTFVIKSAYSIFKSNMSSGIEIKVSTTPVETNEITINLKTGDPTSLTVSGTGYYTENYASPVTIKKGSIDITSTLTINKQYIKTEDNSVLQNGIPKDQPGNYKVVYSVVVEGNTYSTFREIKVS